MEGRFLRPADFPAVEHSLPHDAHAGAVEGLFEDAVVLTRLPAVAKFQILTKEPLLEDVLLEFHPLVDPLLGGPAQFHKFRSDEAVE